MALMDHELRRKVVEEMHLRRWPEFAVPTHIIQIVKLVADEDRVAEWDAIMAMPADSPPAARDSARHVEGVVADDVRILWERHSEASTYTLITASARSGGFPALDDGNEALDRARRWAEATPGTVIRAIRIAIVAGESEAQACLPSAGFAASDLVSCHLGAGHGHDGARIWSDFRIHDDAYGRLLIAANGMPSGDLSRVVQRTQELGNYRNMALVGLPVAQSLWPRLNAVEAELKSLGLEVADTNAHDEVLLARLSDQALELVSIATLSSYRMSATAAYARLVDERLSELAVRPIAGYPSLIDFTQRRLLPAVRTCASLTERINALSTRFSQFTSLLRTRVETRIEKQNARLLASLERSASMQLRLQHLVEGLSVVAISYYMIGLAAYVIKAIEASVPGVSSTMLLAIITPITLTMTWLGLRTLRNRVLGKGDS
jgi:uncharacterized membrane-anchored protein